jgi:hypothetical protein
MPWGSFGWSAVAIGDVTPDAGNEIVAVSETPEAQVRVMSFSAGVGGVVKDVAMAFWEPFDKAPWTDVAVGNIDSVSGNEIVTVANDGKVDVFSYQATGWQPAPGGWYYGGFLDLVHNGRRVKDPTERWSAVAIGTPGDLDGDGYWVCEGDCDDNDAGINPGAAEVPDCIDNDCDGVVDEGDVSGPTGNISVSPAYIWPPNHEMVNITVTPDITDANLDTVAITSITSDEPDNGLGDGDTTGDTAITGDLTGAVRAERSGKGDGRTYTVTVTATDCAGNETDFTATVEVPHDRGK